MHLIAAAKVGGIFANNKYRSEFIYNNLQIQLNLIHGAHLAGVYNIIFLGSSCIYPRDCSQPIKEEYLLTGKLEHTNEPYAIAKIAGIKLCESYNIQFNTDYRSLMPTNLYGINDNFHPLNSHVVPALIRKFHEAKVNQKKSVTIWGTGNSLREFLFVDDLAKAIIKIMMIKKPNYLQMLKNNISHINVGSGREVSIKELAVKIRNVVDFKGEIKFDKSKPDGTPRKICDISLIKSTGWKPEVSLSSGLSLTYKWFLENL